MSEFCIRHEVIDASRAQRKWFDIYDRDCGLGLTRLDLMQFSRFTSVVS
jgi:hypothetical protein